MRTALVGFALVATACSGAGTIGGTSTSTVVPPASSEATTTTSSSTTTSSAPVTTVATTSSTTSTMPPVWQRLSRMRFPRSEMPAVVIDGLIHVPGGYMETAQGAAGQVFHETYDPTTDEWSRRADMPEARHHHMAAAAEGRLYVFGGFAVPGGSTTIGTNAWRYTPSSDRWEVLADMPGPVASGAAVEVDGAIVVVGGVPAGTAVYRYSIADDEWEELPSLQQAREHTAAVVVAGTLYAIGGRWGGETFAGVELLEPGAAAWVVGADMVEPRSGFAAAVWEDSVVVGGGEDLDDLRTLSSVEVFGADGWSIIEPLPVPLHGFAFVTVDNALYSVGGSRRAGEVSNNGELYVRVG